MSYRDCIARIAQAAGRKLSDDEIRGIYERVHQAALDIKAGRGDVKTGDMFPDIVSQAAQKAAADLMAEAAQQKRQAEMQVVKMSARMGEVQRIKELGIEKHQLDALDRTHFRNYDGKADVQSYESRFTGIRDMYSSKLLDTWHALGNDFLGFWQDKSKLKDLLREILGEDTGNALARQGAKKWSETVEAMRKHFNSEGGAIGKLDEGYLPQGWWDQERVARMGEQKFVDALLPALKKEAASGRHYNDGGIPWDEARLREFLSKSYDTISTGGHINTEPGKFMGVGKTANRHAEHRQIHFPDADSTLAAWETFGGKTALEIMTGHVEVMARDIALLEHYGPNPQMTIRTLLADALKNDVVADRPNKQKLEARAARMEDYINYSIGKTEPIAHPRLSRFISTMIPLNVASKLGGAVWASAFGDKPMMEAVAHLNNLPELRRWSNELSLFNPANAADRRALQRQGLMLETARNGLLRFGDDLGNAPLANKLASAVMRITGMNAINGLRKGSHGAMLMDAIGFELKRGVDFNGLHDTDRRILKSYGITAQDWAIWQKADLDDMGKGYTMLTPEAISRIPDAEIANIAAPVVQAMKDKAYAEITELTRRNVQENKWLQERANRIKQAEARAADRLNKFMTTRDTRLQKAGEWFKTQQDMIKAKVELAESQADIDAYLLQQKSRNQMTDAVVDLITKRNPERSAERVLRESDKRGDTFSRQRGNIGEKLGDRRGNAERRIVELDARLRQMERDADAEIKMKYVELTKGIDAQWKELDKWIEGMKDRTTRRDFVIERIANEIPNKEIELTAKARRDAIVKLLGAVNTEADFAIVTPGMKERAQFHSIGNKAGYGGEIGRAVLQFKSFPWAMFRRQMDAFNNMNGPVPKAAMASYLVVSTTLAGAMIMQVRDMLAGKDPRDMTKPEFWGAAFLQGGALGIYGDFIYGAGHTRYGSGILEAASGPTVGPLLEMGLVQPIQAIAKAKEGKDTKIVAQTVQDAKGFVPGNNIWYTKAALDHLIWQQTMDALSPGYLSSIRSRTRKEFGQDWWWGPGETTPARAPNLGAAIGE